jgi:hypothetical protein
LINEAVEHTSKGGRSETTRRKRRRKISESSIDEEPVQPNKTTKRYILRSTNNSYENGKDEEDDNFVIVSQDDDDDDDATTIIEEPRQNVFEEVNTPKKNVQNDLSVIEIDITPVRFSNNDISNDLNATNINEMLDLVNEVIMEDSLEYTPSSPKQTDVEVTKTKEYERIYNELLFSVCQRD